MGPVNQQNNADMRAVFNVLGAEHTLLDGNDVNVENEWRRADGTSVEYFNWGAGEPKIKTSPAQSPWQNRHQLLIQLDVPSCFDCFKDGTSDKITYLISPVKSNQS